ncbi:hypothetical protein V8C86DRAFT_2580974 [Haematococcus lacustris]
MGLASGKQGELWPTPPAPPPPPVVTSKGSGPAVRPELPQQPLAPPLVAVLGVLASVGVGVAAVLLLAPTAVAKVLLLGGRVTQITSGHAHMVMMLGAALQPSLAAARELQHASKAGLTAAGLPRYLAAALALHCLMALGILGQAVSLRNPTLVGTVLLLTIPELALAAYISFRQARTAPGGLWASITSLPSHFLYLLTPMTWRGTLSALTAISLFGMGAHLLSAGPGGPNLLLGTLVTDSVAIFTARQAGAALVAAGVVMAGLKSVADKGLHTARMPAQLNGSVALMAAALSTVLLFARWAGTAVGASWVHHLQLATLAVGLAALTNWPPLARARPRPQAGDSTACVQSVADAAAAKVTLPLGASAVSKAESQQLASDVTFLRAESIPLDSEF